MKSVIKVIKEFSVSHLQLLMFHILLTFSKKIILLPLKMIFAVSEVVYTFKSDLGLWWVVKTKYSMHIALNL